MRQADADWVGRLLFLIIAAASPRPSALGNRPPHFHCLKHCSVADLIWTAAPYIPLATLALVRWNLFHHEMKPFLSWAHTFILVIKKGIVTCGVLPFSGSLLNCSTLCGRKYFRRPFACWPLAVLGVGMQEIVKDIWADSKRVWP